MGRSSGVMMTVKVPIRWEAMTARKRERLIRITGRDTRVIKEYLGIIERHEKSLLTGARKKRIDAGHLDELTLRTTERTVVIHDFKARFRTISVNEFQECRETAMGMWYSYLGLGGKRPTKAKRYAPRKLPRSMFTRMFEIVYTPEKTIKHWLILRDSLDSVRQGRVHHDRLAIPLSPSSYHLKRLKTGDIKSIQIVKDKARHWWVMFKVRVDVAPVDFDGLPPAVVGIDLGIKRAVCSVLITRNGPRDFRFWTQDDKVAQLERYDRIISSLQKRASELAKQGRSTDGVTRRFRALKSKRHNISLDHDRKLVRALTDYILMLSERYGVYVAIGRLKGIRWRARRGNGSGRKYRTMIHRWTFARITDELTHKLQMSGFPKGRVTTVPEAWTSIKCHKCGSKGVRPKQSYFLCPTCGYKDNADKNGAINIALRLIRLIPSLRDEKTGLGTWLPPDKKWKSSPKTRRSRRSKGRSSAPKRSPASSSGGIVADRYEQTTLELFASGTDPAMTRTMEDPSAIMDSGEHDNKVQRTEAMSAERSSAPMTRSKARAHPVGEVPPVAGDSSHEKG